MKSYVYTKPFTIEMQERPLLEPKSGQVRLKVKAVSICGSDIGGFKGTSAMRVAPLVMGHEFAGIVDAVGEGADVSLVGARVGVHPTIACGTCPECESGLPNICNNRFTPGTTMPAGPWDGAFAEYVVVPQDRLIRIPDVISFEEAAVFEPASVALRGAKKMGDIKGKTVAVFGAGPIGLLTMQSARIMGAATIIAIDIVDERLAMAKKFSGASTTINSSKEDAVAKARDATNGLGVDASADCVGIATSLNTCIKMTKNDGIVSMVGMASAQIDGFEYKECVTREIHLQGSYCYTNEPREIADLLVAGKFDFKSLITSVVPMSQVQKKMEELVFGSSTDVKVILVD
ncbi:MAG: alcohol dehydrogenase catalytic domain-containing protein [Planctomycetaceae bacterium]|nr:alcohol dehydrogenase catalytic domain-containing protein [Planctomycetaceae bacterium]